MIIMTLILDASCLSVWIEEENVREMPTISELINKYMNNISNKADWVIFDDIN